MTGLLANCIDVPKAEMLRAVEHVRSLFPENTIEEIWFQGTDTLIVERFALKTEIVPFSFTRIDHARQ